MSRGPTIRSVNIEAKGFKRGWRKLPQYAQEQGKDALKALVLPPDQRPQRLHLHKLNYSEPVWTVHLTRDDRYKASLTLDGDVAFMRRCGLHDYVDANPI